MDTAHSNTRCPVFLHPAAASNPATVDSIQQATGQLVVITGGKPQLSKPNFVFSTGDVEYLPTDNYLRRFLIADDPTTDPFGGDAA